MFTPPRLGANQASSSANSHFFHSMSQAQGQSRRWFLRTTTLAAAGFFSVDRSFSAGVDHPPTDPGDTTRGPRGKQPWFRRTFRWGQTNLTEEDPTRCDVTWWRAYWKRTRVQGVIINAGGIVAYYPSQFPLHFRARTLGTRDLYGELA